MGAAPVRTGLVTPDDGSPSLPAPLELARLEARVAALEAALERRSRELRRLQSALPRRELVVVSRLLAGLSPFPVDPYDPREWQETTALSAADVEEVLTDLWRSLEPAGDGP